MKSFFTIAAFLLILFSSDVLYAQITTASQWAWMKGDSTTNTSGVYGTQGVAAATNKPGARYASHSWKDATGNFWLFGGSTYSSGSFNDLWKYNTSANQWIWMKGSNTTYQLGIYGTQGTPATGNTPGTRNSGITWTDTAGNFWLFGGQGISANPPNGEVSILNDLWKYTPTTNEWTWVNGANTQNQQGVYGTRGVPAAANRPGARYAGCSWKDAAGKFWLFGGLVQNAGSINYFNDLWKYDPVTNQWTWMNGSSLVNGGGVYGTTGVPNAGNTPGARSGSITWTDNTGNLWLFGGAPPGFNFLNDLWKYNPVTNQWACVSGTGTPNQTGIYGTPGVAAAANKPGARSSSVFWTDSTGNFYLLGGYGFDATSSGTLSDLWEYHPATGQWTWIKGEKTISSNGAAAGLYGTQGVAAAANKPGARSQANSWIDGTGTVWLFGGYGFPAASPGTLTTGALNDLWKINSTIVIELITPEWTWIKGDSIVGQQGVYGTKGVANTANKPGARSSAISWKDKNNNLWLFGGIFYNNTTSQNSTVRLIFNDLWKYNPPTNQWTWVHGTDTGNQAATYGVKGVADPANTPGSRTDAVSWTDTAGNFWLFGGRFDIPNSPYPVYYYNDLWKYNPSVNQWTWVHGDSGRNAVYGVYGTKGVAGPANKPGQRNWSATWTDTAGNLWLFGGQGIAAPGTGFGGSLNDLWKYNPATNQWAWMSGSNITGQLGVYGTQGFDSPGNTPGARYGSITWTDASGALWLFGGRADDTSGTRVFNDLWNYNTATNQWAWINGETIPNQPGEYGSLGIAAATNQPGARVHSIPWQDATGNLWLFGGESYSSFFLNDLWKYNPATNQWTWVDGADRRNGIYGTIGVADAGNIPGDRFRSVSWTDDGGNFWLFGGYKSSSSSFGYINDLWKRSSANASIVSVSNGLWSNPSTWAGGVVPSTSSIVTIHHNITVQANTGCYSIRIEGSNGNVTVATGVQFTVFH